MGKIYYKFNQKIGQLTYLSDNKHKTKEKGVRYANFKCMCGIEFVTTIAKAKNGHTRSCGCLHSHELSQRNFKHGMSKRGYRTKEYNIWLHIKRRCTNHNTVGYKYWGGKGINMCDKWFNSFNEFYKDMGICPNGYIGIDRVDNSKDYCKENCRWATHKMQMNNTTRNVFIEYKGQVKTLSNWCSYLDLVYTKAAYHVRANKKTIEEIFSISKKI